MIFAASGNEYNLCKTSEFQVFKLPVVSVNSSIQDSLNETKFEINLLRFLDPDVVVSDNHNEAILAAKYLGIPSVAICDLPPILLFPVYAVFADLILIPQIPQGLIIPDYLLKVNEKVRVVGPILDEECFKQMEKINLDPSGPKEKERMIVVYASRNIAERKQYLNLILSTYKMIKKMRPDDKLVLIGPGLTQETEIESLTGLIIHDYVPSLIKYISESDLFITRAPVSAMEAIALGIPTIIIPISGDIHQKTISHRLNDLGVLSHFDLRKTTPKFFKEKINILLSDDETRTRIIDKGRSLMSVSGGKKSAELILDAFRTPDSWKRYSDEIP